MPRKCVGSLGDIADDESGEGGSESVNPDNSIASRSWIGGFVVVIAGMRVAVPMR